MTRASPSRSLPASPNRHCEERSDEAIQARSPDVALLDCFVAALLAMTIAQPSPRVIRAMRKDHRLADCISAVFPLNGGLAFWSSDDGWLV
jgi:hypothetical protein